MQCRVITASRSVAIGDGLDYAWDGTAPAEGSAVRVPLRNRLIEGIVVEILQEREEGAYKIKAMKDVLGSGPLLTEAQMKTARWMAEEYACTLRQALGVWLPGSSWAKMLPDAGEEEFRRARSPILARPTLTSLQQAAYDEIRTAARPSLLFGITGSGKTEVYAQMIGDTIEAGRQAILLVPEILLTQESVHRFRGVVEPDAIAVIHSRLTPKERREIWKRVRRGEIALVIGSRSALFAPCSKLGLVILDEEHEWTYKNEQAPHYHARETADALCRYSGAKLILGSATPSLESWARAKAGAYHLARLPRRFRDQPLPAVRIVDLADARFGKLYPFSKPLIEAIGLRLERGEQSVLFLNRRGVASALLCMGCRRRVVCPESNLPFTVHHDASERPYLLDHTTGIVAEVPDACPHCKSPELFAVGAGTQKIDLLLRKLFPKARILRADADTLRHPEDMRSILAAMRDREADILLGTQSVVKGLDLPQVTLAAVLLADIGLSLPHFRAGERIFQLLTQLTGRSGRAKPGEVIIQTFRPDAPELLAAATHETEKYLDDEWKLRLHSGYPPATRMIRLLVRGPDAEQRARALLAQATKAAAISQSDTKASTAPTVFGGGREWHVLLRGSDPRSILPGLDLRGAAVDVDPVETL